MTEAKTVKAWATITGRTPKSFTVANNQIRLEDGRVIDIGKPYVPFTQIANEDDIGVPDVGEEPLEQVLEITQWWLGKVQSAPQPAPEQTAIPTTPPQQTQALVEKRANTAIANPKPPTSPVVQHDTQTIKDMANTYTVWERGKKKEVANAYLTMKIALEQGISAEIIAFDQTKDSAKAHVRCKRGGLFVDDAVFHDFTLLKDVFLIEYIEGVERQGGDITQVIADYAADGRPLLTPKAQRDMWKRWIRFRNFSVRDAITKASARAQKKLLQQEWREEEEIESEASEIASYSEKPPAAKKPFPVKLPPGNPKMPIPSPAPANDDPDPAAEWDEYAAMATETEHPPNAPPSEQASSNQPAPGTWDTFLANFAASVAGNPAAAQCVGVMITKGAAGTLTALNALVRGTLTEATATALINIGIAFQDPDYLLVFKRQVEKMAASGAPVDLTSAMAALNPTKK